MTTEEVVRLNKELLDAWNKHDTEKFLSLCDVNVVWKDTGVPQTYKGKEGASKFFNTWTTAFPDFRITLLKSISNENSIACEIEFTGTNKGPMKMGDAHEIPATNKKVTINKGCYFAWFKNGKVTEVHTYPDLAGMMQQLGLMQEVHA